MITMDANLFDSLVVANLQDHRIRIVHAVHQLRGTN